MTMPTMPNTLPRRLVTGLDRPRNARMKSTRATRYSNPARSALILACPSSLLFLLIHPQHTLGDQKTAEYVHRSEHHGHKAKSARNNRAAFMADQRNPDGQKRADHDHRGNSISHRHQRGMQRRRHRPHHEVADENREHEDREAEYEGIDGAAGCIMRGDGRGIRIGLGSVGGLLQLLRGGTGEASGLLKSELGHVGSSSGSGF